MKVISEFQNYIQARNKQIRDEFKRMKGGTVAKVQYLSKKYGRNGKPLHEQSIYNILRGRKP